jgi:F-type H+-transporting ATPase subunit b
VDFLAIAGQAGREAVALAQTEGETGGLTINLFWILVSALNLVLFLAIVYVFAFRPLAATLEERRERIDQGLRDAEQARRDRDSAEAERAATLAEARREANDILGRAQKVAQDAREADLAATREELERLRQRAAEEIEAEKQRAIADLRSEVADLALQAASRVVGETMTTKRERRLVAEFLAETTIDDGGKAG